MKFVIHNTGDWVRVNDYTAATRTEGWVKEYNSLDNIKDLFDKDTFEWMLDVGEYVTSSGNMVWQIRN